MLNDLDLKEFQELCLVNFNLVISEEQSLEYGSGLINLLIGISSHELEDES